MNDPLMPDEIREALAVAEEINWTNGYIRDGVAFFSDGSRRPATWMESRLAAEVERLTREVEAQRCEVPPEDWEPAKAEWHRFHLDQTEAQRVRAEAAEAEVERLTRENALTGDSLRHLNQLINHAVESAEARAVRRASEGDDRG
jgi:hypothetical protein